MEIENYKEIEFLKSNIDRLKRERNSKISKTTSIKTISICCLALLGILSLNILYLVLGGLVLSYRTINEKKSGLQWTSGFLLILPIILFIISQVLLNYSEYIGSDDYWDYYYYPYLTQGIIVGVIGVAGFYSGAICSLIFINKEVNNIENHYQEMIDELIQKLKF